MSTPRFTVMRDPKSPFGYADFRLMDGETLVANVFGKDSTNADIMAKALNDHYTKQKGEFNGVCNRTVCNNQPATYYNSSTRAYYCPGCAHKINRYNPGLCKKKEE